MRIENHDKTEYLITDPSENLVINGTKAKQHIVLNICNQRNVCSDLDVEQGLTEARKVIGLILYCGA